ncbi:nuclear transport factor 2 [Trichonephila inaurata madagascariensis]|uniref:NTF2-related export protein n=1 Tax=Trichonephila inaurata madagascariensis TaxID=2747483 RepID=A0A8X7CFY2_9ARAC|nr:nuclear transport factor 2 [Trichonephila inaurata madagascariensis]
MWNLQYDQIGRTFVQQYYAYFDDPIQRAELSIFYQDDKSLMSFEGEPLFGRKKIMEKIQSLTFRKIAHNITSVDTQPMLDGGILITVLGQLKTDDDPPRTFHEIFVLKSLGDIFYVEHDIFRLSPHLFTQ